MPMPSAAPTRARRALWREPAYNALLKDWNRYVERFNAAIRSAPDRSPRRREEDEVTEREQAEIRALTERAVASMSRLVLGSPKKPLISVSA